MQLHTLTRMVLIASLVVAPSTLSLAQTRDELTQQVRDTESAFAATMARRDLAGFASFLADDAIFFGKEPLRGKAAVVAGWKGFYEGDAAPFSWSPAVVEVLDDGTLAHSSGPVLDPQGRQVATFSSVWRREADGKWKIVFDKGCSTCPACAAEKKQGT